MELVQRERPDLVLQELAERRLAGPVAKDPGFIIGRAQLEFEHYDVPGGGRVALLRPATDKPAPLVILFHGGGWRGGEAAEQEPLARELAASGYAVALPSYRRIGRETDRIDVVLGDARRAVAWLQSSAARVGIDPMRIAVGGSSAGGHLAFWAAEDAIGRGAAPAALLLLEAVLDTSDKGFGNDLLGERAAALSPRDHVPASLPPVFLLYGTADQVVPADGALAFAAAARARGASVEEVPVEGARHGFSLDTGLEWRESLLRFLAQHLAESR
jgi:acetyl esterase/lipase